MNVGLFGGSFNPPHVGHLIIAETIRDAFGLDQVLWMPNYVPPHKDLAGGTDAQDRLEMVRLAIADHPSFSVSDVEIVRGGRSYTVETLRSLQVQRSDDKWHLIIGADSLADFHNWREPDEIAERAQLIVYERMGVEISAMESRFRDKAIAADAPVVDVSSTMIRRRLREGRSVRYLLPASVQAYIQSKGLYQEIAVPIAKANSNRGE